MNSSKIIKKINSSVLLKNIGVYTFGNILQKAAEFLLIPVFTRFLTPKDYGITGILLSYAGVILPFLIIGLQSFSL
jgi:O-antigen/teichoic acid export membrane protein